MIDQTLAAFQHLNVCNYVMSKKQLELGKKNLSPVQMGHGLNYPFLNNN